MALPSPKMTAWSFSRWADYERCPLLAKYKHVEKRKEPDNKYTTRGSSIHKLAEDYVAGKIRLIPPELMNFEDEFKKLKALKKPKPELECAWAFDINWNPVSWFEQTAWCRVKLDVTAILGGRRYVIDHKTGRFSPSHEDQLGLYALGSFLMLPEDSIEVQDWYLDKPKDDEDKILGADFKRADLPALKKDWAKRTKVMLSDTKFSPKPSDKCRFCHFRKDNGGPCKF